MQENYKKSLLNLIKKSDRLDMIIKSSGYGLSFWASMASISVSTIMVIASLVGVYLAVNVSVSGFEVANTEFSQSALQIAVVVAFSIIYIIFEFLKTYAFKAFISSFSFNGAFMVGSILLMVIGYAAKNGMNIFNIDTSTADIILFGGVVLFIISNAIAILNKKKSKEWFVVFGIVGTIAVTTSTIMANMRTIEIVDKHESAKFENNIMALDTVKEAKKDKSVYDRYNDDIRDDIKSNKRDIKVLKAENKKEVRRINKEVFIDRGKALKDQSWKFRTRLKTLQKRATSLEEQRLKAIDTYKDGSEKVDNKIDEEKTNFEDKRAKYYEKASFIAIWGEIICSFFIAFSVIVHVLNPNIKGASVIQEDVSDTKDNDLKIDKNRNKHKKAEGNPVKDLVKKSQED